MLINKMQLLEITTRRFYVFESHCFLLFTISQDKLICNSLRLSSSSYYIFSAHDVGVFEREF